MCVLTFHYIGLCNPGGCLTAEFFSSAAEEPFKKETQHSWRELKWVPDMTDVSSGIQRDWKMSAAVWSYTLICLQTRHMFYTNLQKCLIYHHQSPRNQTILHVLYYTSNRTVFGVLGIPQRCQMSIFESSTLGLGWTILIL